MIDRREERVSAWVAGELDHAEAVHTEMDVSANPGLMRLANRMRAARDRLRTHGPATAPPSMLARVEAGLDLPRQEAALDARRLAAMVAVGTIAGAVLAALFLALPGTPPPATAPPAAVVAPAEVLVPPGWRLATAVEPDRIRREVESVGATWTAAEGTVSLVFDVTQARGVEQRLASLGELEVVGEPIARTGSAHAVLTIEAPPPAEEP